MFLKQFINVTFYKMQSTFTVFVLPAHALKSQIKIRSLCLISPYPFSPITRDCTSISMSRNLYYANLKVYIYLQISHYHQPPTLS